MILNYHLFTESQRYKEIKKIDINLIRDLFQEYIDKYGLVEVNNSMPWRDMEILDFKIIIGHPLSVYSSELEDNFNGEKNSELGALFILVNDKLPTNMNQDFLSFCERLRKFGYWSNIKHKLIAHKNWIYIYFYKENDIVYELKSNNIDIETIKDLFQEYIDDAKFDLRVMIMGNKAFGYYRYPNKGDFRASGAGNYEKRAIPIEALKIAIDVKNNLHSRLMGVDLLFSTKRQKYYIIEASLFNQIDTPEQLVIDGIPGYYDISDINNIIFKPGKFWIHELVMDEIIKEWNRRFL